MSGGNGLFLMGLKHCGKSTLGKAAAERLSLPFYDLDEIALEAIRREGHASIRELYRNAGLNKFQDFESAAAMELVQSASRGPLIAALGGGTVENGIAMDSLSPHGRFLYLEVEEEELFRRIETGGLPPFLAGEESPRILFHRLYEKRDPLFRRYADERLSLPVQTVSKNIELLISFILSSSTLSEVIHAGK